MRRVEIDWLKVLGGALAAVLSAVLLSTLGAAGTIVGAALGSILVTVGSVYFAEGLASSKRTLTKAQAGARQKVGIAEAEVNRAVRTEDTGARDSHLDHAQERLSQANRELDDAIAGNDGWRSRLARLPWRRISWVSAGLFVAAIAIITVFELVVGESVSSITGGTSGGGTTIGDVGNDRSGGGRKQNQPTESPSPNESSDEPSEPDTATPTPTPTPTSTPTESPTSGATTTPEPAQSASP